MGVAYTGPMKVNSKGCSSMVKHLQGPEFDPLAERGEKEEGKEGSEERGGERKTKEKCSFISVAVIKYPYKTGNLDQKGVDFTIQFPG